MQGEKVRAKPLSPWLIPQSNGGHQQLYWSHLRQLCQGSRYCCVCSNQHSPIGKYSLNMCQECSHQYTNDIVFIKWD
ncbi:small ribosomal subunit protein uS14-like [Loxodonta africana]|uniref:small ribosomal subunit protein uS14-like n=1 Tax=Loxodonta africana TaxID=9785 RepID=UPI0030D34685